MSPFIFLCHPNHPNFHSFVSKNITIWSNNSIDSYGDDDAEDAAADNDGDAEKIIVMVALVPPSA